MLRGSERRQRRVLALIGAAFLLCVALAVTLVVVKPFEGRPKGVFSIAITTPYVGQGVAEGTELVLHGLKVGSVTKVTNSAGGAGGVQLIAELQSEPVRGLTDAMNIDFRPINYFGVSGINLIPNPGGQALQDGTRISLVPTGNFTFSQLLNQLGNVSAAALTPQLISVIDRVTRYTDGLNPVFETLITVARAVKAVHAVPTELLLTNLATSLQAVPAFAGETIEFIIRLINYDYYPGQSRSPSASDAFHREYPFLKDATVPSLGDIPMDTFQSKTKATTQAIIDGLFGSVGKLVGSHVDDLVPLISGIKTITDTGPVLLRPLDIAQKLAELRGRFETLYAGNGDQRAISVRILLDDFPAVAAPMGITTGGTP